MLYAWVATVMGVRCRLGMWRHRTLAALLLELPSLLLSCLHIWATAAGAAAVWVRGWKRGRRAGLPNGAPFCPALKMCMRIHSMNACTTTLMHATWHVELTCSLLVFRPGQL